MKIDTASRLIIGAILLGVAVASAAQVVLRDALESLQAELGLNIVVEPDISLDLVLAKDVYTLDELQAELQSLGFKLTPLATGDLQLVRQSTKQVELSSLKIEAATITSSNQAWDSQTGSRYALDGATATALGLTDLDQVFLNVANVFGGRDEFYIRGISPRVGLSNIANSNVLLDGLPVATELLRQYPAILSPVSPTLVDRGPIGGRLRGPFSATGGAVSIRSVAPTFADEGWVSASIEEDGGWQASTTLQGVSESSELGFGLSLSSHRQPGREVAYRDRVRDVGRSDSEVLQLAGSWRPQAWPDLIATMRMAAGTHDGGVQELVVSESAVNPLEPTAFKAVPPFNSQRGKWYQWSMEGAIQLADHHLLDMKLAMRDANNSVNPTGRIPNQLFPTFTVVDDYDDELVQSELGWLGTFSNQFRLYASLAVGASKVEQRQSRDDFLFFQDSELDRTTLAFGGYWEPVSRLGLEASVRIDHDDVARDCRAQADESALGEGDFAVGESNPSDCVEVLGLLAVLPADKPLDRFETSYTEISPTIAASYTWSQHWRSSIRGQRSYNTAGAIAALDLSLNPRWAPFEPEIIESWELDVVGTQVGAGLDIGATIFYATQRNVWSPITDGADFPVIGIANNGRSTNRGGEIELDWQFLPDHQVQASIGYLHTRFEDFVPFGQDVDPVSVRGNRFAGAPRWSGSMHFNGKLCDRWRYHIGAAYYDTAFATANNDPLTTIRSATVLAGGIGYAWHQHEIWLRLNNATDELYLEGVPRRIRRASLTEYELGDPRRFSLQWRWHF